MNNIERVSIPMRDLCLDPCLTLTQLKERTVDHIVEHTFAKAMSNPEDGVSTVNTPLLDAFAESMWSLERENDLILRAVSKQRSEENRRHACVVCGLVGTAF